MNLLVREPGRPRLTWYGDDGERIELSGAVLVNWISKTTNLVVEEFDAGPGCRLLIDLPPHWRTAVWVLGALRAGATAVLPGAAGAPDGREVDVTVTTRPSETTGTGDVVAVTLPALARRFDGELPPGAIDAAAAVMTYADQILYVPDADPTEPAIVAPAERAPVRVLHGDLLGWAAGAPGLVPGARAVVDGRLPLLDALRLMLALWVSDGSVVLTSAATAAALEADPERQARVLDQEGVTA